MSIEYIQAWVTKYALTSGVLMVEGKVDHEISSKILCYGNGQYAHGNDWHRTPYDAMLRAEEMRNKRIKSLQKSLKEMESLKIVVPLE